MKRLALLIALLLAACSTTKTEPVGAGAKLFRDHCAKCHGTDAGGRKDAPSLRSARVQQRPDDSLFRFLTNGDLKRGMPSWSRLPDERRWQLVAYLKSL